MSCFINFPISTLRENSYLAYIYHVITNQKCMKYMSKYLDDTILLNFTFIDYNVWDDNSNTSQKHVCVHTYYALVGI